MTKRDLVDEIAERCVFPKKEIREITELMLDTLCANLVAGEPFYCRGFGTFKKSHTAERVFVKQNGERVVTKPRPLIKFKQSKQLFINEK